MKYLILAVLIGCAYGTAIIKKPKIVGGLTAQDGQFPYQAAIKHLPSNRFFCSGSIISEEWVLTAAFCCDLYHAKNMIVVVGSVYMGNNGFGYGVDHTVKHPLYAYDNHLAHNIALIKIAGSLSFGDYVGSITVSSIVKLPPNLDLLYTGWGITQFPSIEEPLEPADTLQYITLGSVSTDECMEELTGMNITNEMIQCTSARYGHGPCVGDWGGPLVYENEQVGIDPSANSCSSPSRRPGLFTNVGFYRLWIKNITGV